MSNPSSAKNDSTEGGQTAEKKAVEEGVQGAGGRYPGQERKIPSEAGDEHMGAEESDRPGGIAPQEARKHNYSSTGSTDDKP